MPSNEHTVLVTRPTHQSENLCALLTDNDFKPVRFPTIEIQPVDNVDLAALLLQNSHHYDYLIFVSLNSVLKADALIKNQWRLDGVAIISIGPKTADALNEVGLRSNIVADKPFNSEQLLKQLPSDLQQKKGLIIKGEGGRTLLAQQLNKRGMVVDYIDVYKRSLPSRTHAQSIKTPEYITVTSQLALKNLFSLLGQQSNNLKQFSIFVVFSQRIANFAKTLGCQHIITSSETSDASLVAAITHSKKQQHFLRKN